METITFGTFPQKNESEKRPIEWIVLGIRMQKALCISKYALTAMSYCEPKKSKDDFRNIEWQNSLAREWCNHYFLEKAFSDEDRSILSPKGIDATGFGYGYLCQDRVFLLTEKGVRKYLQDYEERKADATDYAKKQGAQTTDIDGHTYANWWILPECVKGDIVNLPSGEQYRGNIYPKAVSPAGEILFSSINIDHDDYTIRPCILVDLPKAHDMGYIQFDKLAAQEFEYYKLGFGAIIKLNREKELLYRLDPRHNVWLEEPGLYAEFMHGNYQAKRIGFDDIFNSDK